MTKIGAPSLQRVYCAGPLFNQAERVEMTQIAETLCTAGFQVYLPHRDGMEFHPVLDELVARGWPVKTAGGFLHAAIFALDVYQLVAECGSVVWNLNGRVPDEGAVSEAAMAWMLGKPMVAYKDDFRTLISSRDNPLLAGLVDFELLTSIEEIPEALTKVLESWQSPPCPAASLPPAVQRAVGQGRLLWGAMCEQEAQGDNLILADVVTELFAPKIAASNAF
jgi:nucleoside 2-deoxyribosyltransferase